MLALCVCYVSAGSLGAIAAITSGGHGGGGGGGDEGYSYGAPEPSYAAPAQQEVVQVVQEEVKAFFLNYFFWDHEL